MPLPGFNAESSLRRPVGTYRGRTLFAGAGGATVSPMAPCCGSTDTKQLRVTFRHTACKPLIDFIVAPRADQFLAAAARLGPAGTSSATATATATATAASGGAAGPARRFAWGRVVCRTDNGPWDATLVERRACVGYAPVHTLTILAHGEPVIFQWNGGVENHPPEVGLVGCRQVSTTRTRCPGALSTCDCQSSACGPTEPCPCGLENQW